MRTNTEPRAFTILEGTPTITFAASGVERMLPYHSFTEGVFRQGKLELNFTDLHVTIEGESMDELWESLQLQDVRLVRVVEGILPEGECLVRALTIRSASEGKSH